MDTTKKVQTIARSTGHLDGPQICDDAATWWATWSKEHSEQIAAYNKEVAENGVWSDGLRAY